jgi:hypothetical protein
VKFDDIQLTVNGENANIVSDGERMLMRLKWLATHNKCILIGRDDYCSITQAREVRRYIQLILYRQTLMTGLYAYIFGMALYISNDIPSGHYYDERLMLLR